MIFDEVRDAMNADTARRISRKNEANYQLFDEFNEWILMQEKLQNYPDFGANICNYRWEILQNMANLADVDLKKGEAKYMLMCRLNYTEKED